MVYFIDDINFGNTELSMYHCGTQKCKPGHYYGPAVRDHFLIHYIIDGKGKFQVENKTYCLNKGYGFLICPGIITYYQADFDNPWHYSWVGFHGSKVREYLALANLSWDNPIFYYGIDSYIEDCLNEMTSISGLTTNAEIKLLGLLYLFISKLIENHNSNHIASENKDRKELYVKKSIEFIEKNYSRNITIEALANYIGISRKYLSSLFKYYMDLTPQEFLIKYRMNKACDLMKDTTLSIGDISRSVGYEDQLLFSKMFKKVKGLCPRDFRKDDKYEKRNYYH